MTRKKKSEKTGSVEQTISTKVVDLEAEEKKFFKLIATLIVNVTLRKTEDQHASDLSSVTPEIPPDEVIIPDKLL